MDKRTLKLRSSSSKLYAISFVYIFYEAYRSNNFICIVAGLATRAFVKLYLFDYDFKKFHWKFRWSQPVYTYISSIIFRNCFSREESSVRSSNPDVLNFQRTHNLLTICLPKSQTHKVLFWYWLCLNLCALFWSSHQVDILCFFLQTVREILIVW